MLVEQLLDPIREAWGGPIMVSSGYRCPRLNELVGGVAHSHHILGCAADITVGSKPENHRLFRLIRQMKDEGRIRFCEGGARWPHLSYVPSDLKCQVIL